MGTLYDPELDAYQFAAILSHEKQSHVTPRSSFKHTKKGSDIHCLFFFGQK